MTEHFTRGEAVALAERLGALQGKEHGCHETELLITKDDLRNLLDVAVTAIDKQREALGAVAKCVWGGKIEHLHEGPPSKLVGALLYTHALPAQPAMPVGELTPDAISELIVEHKLMDQAWPTQKMLTAFALAAARSHPTTEESLVVAGAQPVREPLTPDTHYQEWKHGCASMCTNITLWIDRCPHCGKPRPVVEAAHGMTNAKEHTVKVSAA